MSALMARGTQFSTLAHPADDIWEDTMHRDKPRRPGLALTGAVLGLLLLFTMLCGPAAAASDPTQMRFDSAEAAVEALRTALKNDDRGTLVALFGAEYAPKLLSPEKAVARETRQRLADAMAQGTTLRQDTADRVVLIIGTDQWPFPIPLVKSGPDWRFHTAAGLDEIQNRRIGRDELNAIGVCRAYITAQRDYARKIRDNSGIRKFAQHLVSTKGKQDGLYWDPKTADGEESPFGPLVAEYLKGGRKAGDPYYGYYFRVLTRQGNNVPGGRYNYVINGNMIGGFALVAFPAEYGKTGVMTFLVSHHGKIYQKDLGPNTTKIARDMQEFNPDKTWTEAQD